jgi:hypothetical protein
LSSLYTPYGVVKEAMIEDKKTAAPAFEEADREKVLRRVDIG